MFFSWIKKLMIFSFSSKQIFEMVQELNVLIKEKREKQKSNQEYHLYHGETWELLQVSFFLGF